MRGRLPKPTKIRSIEGNRGHRPLSTDEPRYEIGVPAKPKRMSPAARRLWDEYIDQMAASGVLSLVDRRALWQLCEDEAIQVELYAGIWRMAKALEKKAKAEGTELTAGAMMSLFQMKNGRLAMAAVRDLAARVIIERREFGLTPSARSRIHVGPEMGVADALELKLCG